MASILTFCFQLCHRTNLRPYIEWNFLFCPNSTLNIRKSHKIPSGKAFFFESYQPKTSRGGGGGGEEGGASKSEEEKDALENSMCVKLRKLNRVSLVSLKKRDSHMK